MSDIQCLEVTSSIHTTPDVTHWDSCPHSTGQLITNDEVSETERSETVDEVSCVPSHPSPGIPSRNEEISLGQNETFDNIDASDVNNSIGEEETMDNGSENMVLRIDGDQMLRDSGHSTAVSDNSGPGKSLFTIQDCFVRINLVDESLPSNAEIASTNTWKSGTETIDTNPTSAPSTSTDKGKMVRTRSGPRPKLLAYRRKKVTVATRDIRAQVRVNKVRTREREDCSCPDSGCEIYYSRYVNLKRHVQKKHGYGATKWAALKQQLEQEHNEPLSVFLNRMLEVYN